MEDTGNGKMWFKRVAKEWTVALRESCLKIKAGRIYTWENCQVVCKKKKWGNKVGNHIVQADRC